MTLENSKTCRMDLPTALKSLSEWFEICVNANERELKIKTATKMQNSHN